MLIATGIILLQVWFEHNTTAGVVSIASFMMLSNYQRLMKICGGCPAACLYSAEPGTGKTLALRIAGLLFGVEKVS